MRKNSWLIWLIVLIIAAIIVFKLLSGAMEKLFERTKDIYDFPGIYSHISGDYVTDCYYTADDYLLKINYNDKGDYL